MKTKGKKSKAKPKKKTVYLVKWGSDDNDPVMEFPSILEAKNKILELIQDDCEDAKYIKVYKALAIYKVKSEMIEFVPA